MKKLIHSAASKREQETPLSVSTLRKHRILSLRVSNGLIFLLVLGMVLSGCATMSPYGSLYNEAISKGTSTTIIKEGVFENIRSYTFEHYKSLGYTKVMFLDPKQGFMVLTKNVNIVKAFLVGDPHMYRIILKYTKAGEGKTRIDLVNATDILWAKKDVDKDIQQLAELIKKE